MSSADFTALRYDYLLDEIRRVLSQRGCWQAMPALMDELHRLRQLAQAVEAPAPALA